MAHGPWPVIPGSLEQQRHKFILANKIVAAPAKIAANLGPFRANLLNDCYVEEFLYLSCK